MEAKCVKCAYIALIYAYVSNYTEEEWVFIAKRVESVHQKWDTNNPPAPLEKWGIEFLLVLSTELCPCLKLKYYSFSRYANYHTEFWESFFLFLFQGSVESRVLRVETGGRWFFFLMGNEKNFFLVSLFFFICQLVLRVYFSLKRNKIALTKVVFNFMQEKLILI